MIDKKRTAIIPILSVVEIQMHFFIRQYRPGDLDNMVELFYDTVHTINAQHYSVKQLAVWAAEDERRARTAAWAQGFRENLTFVAEADHKLVGFADMTPGGYLDRLYVHRDFQRQGIATALLDKLETAAGNLGVPVMKTDASITARPFFESRGFSMIKPQEVERRGVRLQNFRMTKQL